MRLIHFQLLLALLTVFSCSPKKYSLNDYTGKKLIVGNGGGFTGQVIEYTIFENGQVFRMNSMNDSNVEKQTLDKNIVSQLFKNYNILRLEQLEYKKPGNMYYYIEMIDAEKKHKIVWGAEQKDKVDNKATLFYNIIMQRLKE